MKQVWVRVANKNDAPTATQWFLQNSGKSMLDEDVFQYPETVVYCAHSDHPLLYMPAHLVTMLESLAPNPAANPMELAASIAEIVKTAKFLSEQNGIHELYFLSTDENIQRIAERHGFELMPYPVLRLKIGNLEKKNDGV